MCNETDCTMCKGTGEGGGCGCVCTESGLDTKASDFVCRSETMGCIYCNCEGCGGSCEWCGGSGKKSGWVPGCPPYPENETGWPPDTRTELTEVEKAEMDAYFERLYSHYGAAG